jgi:hypothetical protein
MVIVITILVVFIIATAYSLPVPILRVAERSSTSSNVAAVGAVGAADTLPPLPLPPSSSITNYWANVEPSLIDKNGKNGAAAGTPNLGTKNGYPLNWHVAATSLSPPSACVPYHINHLGRHGARHMSKNKAPKRLVDYAGRLTGTSMNKTNLAQWAAAALSMSVHPPPTTYHPPTHSFPPLHLLRSITHRQRCCQLDSEIDRDLGQLSYQGRRELAGIARRMMDNFGALLRYLTTSHYIISPSNVIIYWCVLAIDLVVEFEWSQQQ